MMEFPLYTDSNVSFTTVSGIHAPQIAEHVFMVLLAMTHHFPPMLSSQAASRWGGHKASDSYFNIVHDLLGKTMLILGYGAIGRQTARVAKSFGMKVLAYTANPKNTLESRKDTKFNVEGLGDVDGALPDEWISGLSVEERRGFLARDDIDCVVISMPLTKNTKHFLGKEEFALLGKPRRKTAMGAYIINIGRGGIIDHDALTEALKSGGIVGAALDVTEPEPLPSESELWKMSNVIITPHVGGVGTISSYDRALEILMWNLERLADGRQLVNEVSREKGY
jgi:phosphoglycerate dehydrogenase-like enzyme